MGHLQPEPGGPGDHHIGEIAEIDLPELPGLRAAVNGRLRVRVEQYVTASTVYPAVVSVDFGDRAPTRSGYEYLAPGEAHALAWMLIRAATALDAADWAKARHQQEPGEGDHGQKRAGGDSLRYSPALTLGPEVGRSPDSTPGPAMPPETVPSVALRDGSAGARERPVDCGWRRAWWVLGRRRRG
ncbi:hypothetical protein [Parafrankia sp. FMc2]|uniref:hypothetical protein n=1 Tax=Parafrankia sp. FMc2 TaxID=3233196 RepID=UPI0034D49245